MSTDRKDGGPAFPLENPRQLEDGALFKQFPGMSLRDYFAGQALAGLLTHGTRSIDGEQLLKITAAAAYAFADAMIAERAREPRN